MKLKYGMCSFLAAMLIAACATYQRTGSTEIEGGALPPAEGEAVRRYLIQENDYRQWNLWPGKGRFYSGHSPHGELLTTYVSPGVLRALETHSGRIPDGGMIVKEEYAADRDLVAVSVMYRRPGFHPEGGNWYWLRFDPEGEILAEGKAEVCIGCHRKAEENDWLFTGEIR